MFILPPALRTLIRLRIKGSIRRALRSLRTPRGALMGIFGAFMIFSWLVPMYIGWGAADEVPRETILQWMPLGLFVLALSQVITRGSRATLLFSPSELQFLFPAPFRRRDLVLYKVYQQFVGALFVAGIFSVLARGANGNWATRFIALTLLMVFIQLSSTFLNVLGQTIAAHSYTRLRRGVLLVVALVLLLAVATAMPRQAPGDLRAWAAMLEHPGIQTLLAPFRVFTYAFLAPDWPTLFVWGGGAASMDVALLAAILRLDAHHLEASIHSSQKRYRQMEQFRRRGGVDHVWSRAARLRVPFLPYWGGAGVLLRRQMIGAVRSLTAWIALTAAFAFGVAMALVSTFANETGAGMSIAFAAGVLAYISLLSAGMFRYDFRADLDTIPRLKTLPLSGWAVATGEVVAPALVLWLAQGLYLLGYALGSGVWSPVTFALLAVAAPINLFIFAMENIFFLLFPFRQQAAFGDFQYAGRQIVLMLAKVIVAMVCGGAAFLIALGVHFLTDSFMAAGLAGWLVVSVLAMGTIPAVAAAFRRYDPSVHTPA